MEQGTALLIIAIVAKVIEYGPEAVLKIVTAWSDEDITLEKILALKITKEPEEY
jgi:hypothetical protein